MKKQSKARCSWLRVKMEDFAMKRVDCALLHASHGQCQPQESLGMHASLPCIYIYIYIIIMNYKYYYEYE